MANVTLTNYLLRMEREHGMPADLRLLIETVSGACKAIGAQVNRGALAGVLGLAGTENVQGEDQKKLDVISNEIMCDANQWCGALAGMASEEMDHVLPVAPEFPRGRYMIAFDPLDGSSNIDINVSIGTIFSIRPAPQGRDIVDEDFLQKGDEQVAAGYCIYGPQTQFVLTVGHGVAMFTLDRTEGTFLLTQDNVRIPAKAQEFAVNMSNQRHWAEPVKRYVSELLAGSEGPRGKDFNMRWVAAMVADVHRILCRGGVFLYPWDDRNPARPGKLRITYEANPMSFLIEQAGGKSTNGYERILGLQPKALHERVPVFLGAAEEVDLVTSYHKQAK